MSQVKLICRYYFSICVLMNSLLLIKKILSLTLKIQKLLLPLFSVSPRVVPPLPSLQQGLQVRRKCISGEIQQYLSHHFLFFFPSISLSVCLFVTRKLLNANDPNSRKTSAVCSLYKETYSNNANLTGGRAFAVSVLFTCQSSGLSYPLVSLSVGRSFQPVERVVSPCFVF